MFCKNCGKEIKEGTAFCSECGAAQGTVKTAAPNPVPASNQSIVADMTAVKKSKKPLIICIAITVIIITAVIIVIVLSSGNNLSVSDVKSGYLTYYNDDITIGKAFDNYSFFSENSWEKFDSEDGFSVVEFSARIDMQNNDYNINSENCINDYIRFQFYTDDDMEEDEFALHGIFIGSGDDYISLVDYDFDNMLYSIYDDKMFYYMSSDYYVYY